MINNLIAFPTRKSFVRSLRHGARVLFALYILSALYLAGYAASAAEKGQYITKDHQLTGGGWDWLYAHTDAQINAVGDDGQASFNPTGIEIINKTRNTLYFTCRRTGDNKFPVAPGETLTHRIQGVYQPKGKKPANDVIPITVTVWVDSKQADQQKPTPEPKTAPKVEHPSGSTSQNGETRKAPRTGNSSNVTGSQSSPTPDFESSYRGEYGPARNHATIYTGAVVSNFDFENAEAFPPRMYSALLKDISVSRIRENSYRDGWRYYSVQVRGKFIMTCAGSNEDMTAAEKDFAFAAFNTREEAERFAAALQKAQERASGKKN